MNVAAPFGRALGKVYWYVTIYGGMSLVLAIRHDAVYRRLLLCVGGFQRTYRKTCVRMMSEANFLHHYETKERCTPEEAADEWEEAFNNPNIKKEVIDGKMCVAVTMAVDYVGEDGAQQENRYERSSAIGTTHEEHQQAVNRLRRNARATSTFKNPVFRDCGGGVLQSGHTMAASTSDPMHEDVLHDVDDYADSDMVSISGLSFSPRQLNGAQTPGSCAGDLVASPVSAAHTGTGPAPCTPGLPPLGFAPQQPQTQPDQPNPTPSEFREKKKNMLKVINSFMAETHNATGKVVGDLANLETLLAIPQCKDSVEVGGCGAIEHVAALKANYEALKSAKGGAPSWNQVNISEYESTISQTLEQYESLKEPRRSALLVFAFMCFVFFEVGR